MACNAVVGPVSSKRPGRVHLAEHVDVARRPLRQDRNHLDALDDLPVRLVEFGLQFGQRQPLGLDRADGGQGDGALGRDADRLALAADARPAVDRRPQVFQLRIDLQRRDGDGRGLVVLLVRLFQRVAELRDRAAGRVDLAQQPQGDRAVGLNQQAAVDLVVGERFHLDLVAHVQPIGRRGLLARQPVGHVELIVDAEAVLGHVGQPRMADVLALGIRLPVDRAHRLPAPAAIAAGAVHAANVVGRGGTERLAQKNFVSLLRGN